MAFSNTNNCSIIIANDPDADRLGVAEKRAEGSYENTHPEGSKEFITAGWKVFTGNEIGTLLGHRQMIKYKTDKQNGVGSGKDAGVLASVVSSRMLKQMALVEGIQYFDTLTGFKWIGNKSIELQEKMNMEVLFSYEEALGFCVGTVVNDKDGISGASIFVEMICELQSKSNTNSTTVLQDHLQSLYNKYGFAAYNSYVISHDGAVTDEIFHRLRNSGGHNNQGSGYWTECAGSKIIGIKDVTMGYDSNNNTNNTGSDSNSNANADALPTTPDSHMIMYEFENDVSVTLRTSGTEPKIKFYTEIAGAIGEKREKIEAILHEFVENMVEEMLQPTHHKLGRP